MTDREIDREQEYAAGLYARVDAMREQAAARSAGGNRETAALWRAEVARLDAVEQGLCFGRLDLRDGRRVYVGRVGPFRDDDEPLLVDSAGHRAPRRATRRAVRPAGTHP